MSSAGTAMAQPAEPRPLMFGVVVWGETFRECMLRYLLPSLLAAGNLPADIGRQKRVMICCPQDDWDIISAHPTIEAIRPHAEVDWIPYEPMRHRNIRAMSIGHSLCFQRAWEAGGYLSLFPPDSLFSENFVASLGRWIDEGWRLVFCPAFRTEEQAFLRHLGVLDSVDIPISRSARDMNAATIRSLHSQMLVTDIDAAYFFSLAHNFHLRDPDNTWIVARNMAWNPALMDLNGVEPALIQEVARSVIDSYILAKMYRPDESIKFMEDSSDFAMASWAPADWSSLPMRRQAIQRTTWTKRLYNRFAIRKSIGYHLHRNVGNVDDWIKRRALLEPMVVLGGEAADRSRIDAACQRLDAELRRTAGDLLGLRRTTVYDRMFDVFVSAARKFEFIANAILDRGNGRALFRRRLARLFLEKLGPWPWRRNVLREPD